MFNLKLLIVFLYALCAFSKPVLEQDKDFPNRIIPFFTFPSRAPTISVKPTYEKKTESPAVDVKHTRTPFSSSDFSFSPLILGRHTRTPFTERSRRPHSGCNHTKVPIIEESEEPSSSPTSDPI